MRPWKQGVVLCGLLVFTLWPAVHIALVKIYDINPWKLAGWGMYSAPQLHPHMRVFGLTPDDVGVYELSTVPAEVVPVLDGFLERRRVLRNLVRPDEVAHALLEAYSAIDGVRLVVVQPTLNRRTGMIEEIETAYDYSRTYRGTSPQPQKRGRLPNRGFGDSVRLLAAPQLDMDLSWTPHGGGPIVDSSRMPPRKGAASPCRDWHASCLRDGHFTSPIVETTNRRSSTPTRTASTT